MNYQLAKNISTTCSDGVDKYSSTIAFSAIKGKMLTNPFQRNEEIMEHIIIPLGGGKSFLTVMAVCAYEAALRKRSQIRN